MLQEHHKRGFIRVVQINGDHLQRNPSAGCRVVISSRVTTALGSRRDRANGAPQLIVRPVIVSERAARSGFYGTVRRWVITWP